MDAVPHEQLLRIDRGLLYPPFRERIERMVVACNARGAFYYATAGFRSFQQQELLWRAFKSGGPRAAPAGLSAHNYGCAIDFVRDGEPKRFGVQPVWHSKDYVVLGEEAKRVGLAWGGTFGDRPHVGWPGLVHADELAPLLARWDIAKTVPSNLEVVWGHIDRLPEYT